jgi:hypothetical protein
MRVTGFFLVYRNRVAEAFSTNVGYYNAECKIKSWDLLYAATIQYYFCPVLNVLRF